MRALPLGVRIVLLVIPLAFLPLALLGGVAYYYIESATRSEIDTAETRLLSDAIALATNTIEDAAGVSLTFPTLPPVRQFIDTPRDRPRLLAGVRRTMDVSLQLSRDLSAVSMVVDGGSPIITAGSPLATPVQIRDVLAAAGPSSAGTDADRAIGLVGQGTVILIVSGVRGPRGRVLVGAEVGVRRVMDKLATIARVPAARLDLVDENLGVLASAGAIAPVLRAEQLVGAIREARATRAPRRVESAAGAIVMVAPLAPFVRPDEARPGPRPLFLVRTAPESGLVDRIRELRRTALLLSLTAIAFGLIGAGVIARTVVHPLNALLDMTRRIGEGQFAVSLEQTRNDEIGQLVGAFNRMAAALAELQDKLIRAETFAALGRVASTVAHEVRNPLNAMRGCIEYIRLKRPDDPIVQHHASIISDEITRLDEFVRDFLKVARLENPRCVPIDVFGLVRSHLELHRQRASGLGVSMELTTGDGSFEANADPAQIAIVIENLVTNALEAMPAGGRLHVHVASAEEDLVMTFADTGPGMPPSVQQNLFTPFFTTKTDGAGIGLAISRRIIEAHGGTIRYTTTPGAGTVFTVTVPREPAAGDEKSAKSDDSIRN
jgi:signal transduction histidine kinase